jgi:hypothetical protein
MKNEVLKNNIVELTKDKDDKFKALVSLLCDDKSFSTDLIVSSLSDEEKIQLRDKINLIFANKECPSTDPIIKDPDDMSTYLSDDRDFEDQASINAYWMNNGDYYLSISWKDDSINKFSPSVRFSTSGGASSSHPRLTTAVSDIYRSIRHEPTSIERMEAERNESYDIINRILEKDISFQEVSDFMMTKF